MNEQLNALTLGVVVKGEKVIVSSLDVARVFEKEHRDILKAIRNLDCSLSFNERNFALVEYRDSKGELRPAYQMTRDGFTFLAMGFTGERAAQFKEAYISAFNQMEKIIREGASVKDLTNPDNIMQMLQNWKQDRDEKIVLQKQVKHDAPKVLFAKAYESSSGLISMNAMSKQLRQRGVNMGQNRFFKWNQQSGLLMKRNGEYLPTQRAMELGIFELKNSARVDPTGRIITYRTVQVTGKGQVYFINKFLGETTLQLPEFANEALGAN